MGKLGQQIASEKLTIVDDGAAKGLVGAKGITCEGLPTGRTELIKDGKLVGLLANHYESQRLQRDPRGEGEARRRPEGRGVGARAAERLPLRARRRASLQLAAGHPRDEHRRAGRHRVDGGDVPARGERDLHRAHLVHVPGERPARGRLHGHGRRRFVRDQGREARRAGQAEHAAHQRERA